MKRNILCFFVALVAIIYSAAAQTPPGQGLSGKITGEDGRPLPGATIRVENTNIAVSSDVDGDFTLFNIPEKGVIIASFLGYKSAIVPYNKSDGQHLSIKLKSNAGTLDEVVIIGYGETSRRFNTGSVSSISAEDIEKQPVTNPLAALQGQAAGVFVQTQNGLPGGNITIQIHGQGSISSGTDPLYIVDGVPFLSSPLYGTGEANGANGPISPLGILNPSDIASISILKDADETAIYGSRGANGVVLITTKKGVSGKDNLIVDYNQGFNKVSRLNAYLNLQQYLQLREQAFKNDGVTPTSDVAPDLLLWDTTKSTNWQKYFYGGTANVTNLQASLTGGDPNTRYLASFNYHDEGSILPGGEDYKKGGGYINIDHTSTNKKFNTVLSVSYNRDDNHTLYSLTNNAGTLPPDFPVYNPDGSYNWSIDNNPVASLGQKQNSQTGNINFNDLLKYTIINGFDAKISFGYNNYTLAQVATLPASAQDANYSPIDVAYFANSSSESYIIEPQLAYNKHIQDGVIALLLGGTYQYRENESSDIEGDGVSNPDLLGNLGAANSITNKSNSYSQYKYESLFGRVNYRWREKYILDLNLRRDGSSRFGPGRQFGTFYALGGAWLFSEENFIKDNLHWLSFGKLRSSYGLTGNDQISDYQYLASYGSGQNYDGISTLTPTRLANPYYGWETTKKLELAMELGFLKDRILFTGSWYRDISSNQLIAYSIPYITGFSSYQANFPAVVQNTGWEFELHTQPIKGNSFNWQVNFNLTIPSNKLVSFPGIASTSYANTLVVGQDLSVVKGFDFTGVNPQTGLAEFKDLNHDGVISFPADVVVLGKTSPDFFGGLGNTFSFKRLQFDIFLEFVKRDYAGYPPALGTSAANDPAFVLNRWEAPGDITSIPRATIDQNNLADYYTSVLTNASYIRCKNLSLSYALNPDMLHNWKIAQLKVFIEGENLFVIANKDLFDPEIGDTGGIPPLKTLTAGLKLTF